MDIKLIEEKYTAAINTIIDKAEEFSNIKMFNEQIESVNNTYYEKQVSTHNKIQDFEKNFDNYKDKHIEFLKKELQLTILNAEINELKDGNIFHNLDLIEKYLEDSIYVKEIELIIAINIYSSFKSIRSIPKSKYPLIHKLLSEKKHSLQLKFNCPFCNYETKKAFFKKTKPYSYEMEIETLSECNCNFPERYDDVEVNINKIYTLLKEKNKLVQLKLDNDALNKIEEYIKKNFSEFYHFEKDYISFFEEENEFDTKNTIDKHIWSKIKNNDYKFNDYEYNKLKKTPNAVVNGIKIYNLKKVLDNLKFKIKKINTYQNNIEPMIYKGSIYIDFKFLESIYNLNSSFIDYIKNYKNKKTLPKTGDIDEVLALGHFCKSNNLLMEDVCQYISLLEYCKKYDIEVHEIKEIIAQNS